MTWIQDSKDTLSNFMYITKLGEAADSFDSRECLQRFYQSRAPTVITNCTIFRNGMCWILHQGLGNLE